MRRMDRGLVVYQELVDDCRHNNWRVWYLPVEVGCRGYVGQSLCRTLQMLGQNRTREKEDHNSSRKGDRTMVTVDMDEKGGEVENIDIV